MLKCLIFLFIGFYVPQTAQTFTVVPGQTATVTFNNVLKRGSLTVTKSAEDGLLEGHRFHLFGTSDSGLEVNAYAVTDSTGYGTTERVIVCTISGTIGGILGQIIFWNIIRRKERRNKNAL